MTAIVVIEAVVILLLLILVAGLLRSHAEILRQLDRLGASEDGISGDPGLVRKSTGLEKAPSAELRGVDPHGAARVVTLRHGRGNTLIAFLSSGCVSCQVFWQQLSGDYDLPTPDTRIVIVTRGPARESPSRISELAPKEVPLVMSDDTWDLFKVPLTPYFLLLDGDARVLGEGSASSWDRLLGMFRQSAADGAIPTGHPAGLDTSERESYTDSRLTHSGIEPGDPALHENPLDR